MTQIGILCGMKGNLTVSDLAQSFLMKEERGTYYEVNLTVPYLESGLVSLFGYFQSPRYFDQHREEIKNFLQIKREILSRVETEMPEVTLPNAVAVHVRRGDYLSSENLYNIFDIDYYIRALSVFPTDSILVVTSDDLAWCRKNFDNLPYKIVYSKFTDPIYDFAILSRCKSLIMANSSFSWWAAYMKMLHFGNGTVVAPRPWYNTTGRFAPLNSDELYLQHWLVVTV